MQGLKTSLNDDKLDLGHHFASAVQNFVLVSLDVDFDEDVFLKPQILCNIVQCSDLYSFYLIRRRIGEVFDKGKCVSSQGGCGSEMAAENLSFKVVVAKAVIEPYKIPIVVHDVHQLFEAASQRLEGINRGFRK